VVGGLAGQLGLLHCLLFDRADGRGGGRRWGHPGQLDLRLDDLVHRQVERGASQCVEQGDDRLRADLACGLERRQSGLYLCRALSISIPIRNDRKWEGGWAIAFG